MQGESTFQKAAFWQPRAYYLHTKTFEICKYIDAAISNLNSNSVSISTDSLYRRLNLYKGEILRIDPDIYELIKNNAESITHYYDSARQIKNENFDLHLSKKQRDEQLYLLSESQQNIRIIEEKVLIFCNNKVN